MKAEHVRKKGKSLLADPIFNKDLGFVRTERDRLSLRGLLPSQILDVKQQEEIVLREFQTAWAKRASEELSDEIIKNGVSPDDVRKWQVLQGLQDRNETLFYKLLMDNFREMSPIIYTPTIGWVCSHFSHTYRRSRGMYFSRFDRHEMASMVYNWEHDEVDAVVVTDGSRVLGLGDQGIGGLAISIGKLDLYVAAGGFHPKRVLPCVLDVGTNNQILKNDPTYLGDRQDRLRGSEYDDLVDEFMAAVHLRWPRALIQFEDFESSQALRLLKRYKKEYLMFNDDVQGTAATVLAGLYGAMKVKGRTMSSLKDEIILVAGAGSASSGVLLTIRNALQKRHGLSMECANSRLFVTDVNGLITKGRHNLSQMEETFYDLSCFAAGDTSMEGLSLLDSVKKIKPTILIGLSGKGGIFTEDVLNAMTEYEKQPIIFALSNPTSRSECSAEQAQRATGGKAIFASGSPFPEVEVDGVMIASSQCNNRFIFPGLALGASLGQTGVVTNAMINKSAEALVELLSEADLSRRATFPENVGIREIAAHLATRVFEQAIEENLKIGNNEMLEIYEKGGDTAIKEYILHQKMWWPDYRALVYREPGKGE